MDQSVLEVLGALVFAVAVLHTFFASSFKKFGNRFKEGSVPENFFHLLGEVEVTFGLWAFVLMGLLIWKWGSAPTVLYLETLNFTEPLFVFAIMSVAATRPILHFARALMRTVSRMIPIRPSASLYFSCLVIGPLLGSLITEPAAMTVTALLLKELYYDQDISERFKYLTIGTLFVNISIGGVLTSFAAPPVLMVAHKWGWDTAYMFSNYGAQAVVAIVVNSLFASVVLRKEFHKLSVPKETMGREKGSSNRIPFWVTLIHLLILGGIVFYSHHSVMFLGLFLLFLGIHAVTSEFNDPVRLKDALLVAFFLAGLVVLGSFQAWWLRPIIQSMDSFNLYISTTLLTAITDNAALTYLGSQVQDLTDISKHALVAGAVVGGGLTVIANAPNPAGYSILQNSFRGKSISALKLLGAALIPTIVAFVCLK